MSDRKFSKPSLALQEQADFLRDQGLIISDEQEALNALSFIGYYRFSGYLLPYKQPHREGEKRTFKPNTHFSDVLELYQFDQSLRALVSTAIEKIEIAFRASLVNTTSMALGPFWYSDEKLHRNTQTYELIMNNIEKISSNSHDIFIRHYRTQYSYPKTPPIWMIATAQRFITDFFKPKQKQFITDYFKPKNACAIPQHSRSSQYNPTVDYQQSRAFLQKRRSSCDSIMTRNGYCFCATANFSDYAVYTTTDRLMIIAGKKHLIQKGTCIATAKIDNDSALEHIQASPLFRRQGIGKKLIRFIN